MCVCVRTCLCSVRVCACVRACVLSDYQQTIYMCVYVKLSYHIYTLNVLCGIASKLQRDNSCSLWNNALFKHVIVIGNKVPHALQWRSGKPGEQSSVQDA